MQKVYCIDIKLTALCDFGTQQSLLYNGLTKFCITESFLEQQAKVEK